MGTIDAGGKTFEVDEEGYLVNLADWNEDLAGEIAKARGKIVLEAF